MIAITPAIPPPVNGVRNKIKSDSLTPKLPGTINTNKPDTKVNVTMNRDMERLNRICVSKALYANEKPILFIVHVKHNNANRSKTHPKSNF